jgi:hypothetical protein
MIRTHQPGSQPIDIPEVIPNPALVPKQEPTPKEPARKEPVKVPEKVGQDCVIAAFCNEVVTAEADVNGLCELDHTVADRSPGLTAGTRTQERVSVSMTMGDLIVKTNS